jgi:arylformamidase
MNQSSQDTSRFVDVSHAVEDGMITYRGLPAPIICDYLSRAESRQHYCAGTEFQIGKIEMVANTGTYVDSPFHRYADGADLSQLSLPQLANLEGIVVHTGDLPGQAIDASLFHQVDVRDKAVLVHTGWDTHWGSEQYFEGHPYLTRAAAQFLANGGARLVGIDSLNIDDVGDTARPVHSILLKAGVPIVEHLCNLGALPREGFKFFAVPVKVKGMGTFPVRAFGMI